MRIEKAGGAETHLDSITGHLVLHDLNFVLDDVVGAKGKVFNRDPLFETVGVAIDTALPESRQIEYGFAEGFARYRATVNADPADDFLPLDNANLLAKFRCLDRGFLTGRSGSYDEQIIVGHGCRGRTSLRLRSRTCFAACP